MLLRSLYNEFFRSEKSGGLLLVLVTGISLFLANSSLQIPYVALWHIDLGGESVGHWINDGLMTLFFLLIGLELEREIYCGELSSLKNASLPLFAALGGMLVPAAIFLLFNMGAETRTGAGIPMATDIAFALAILSLLGKRVPLSLKIFLTALAVIDDLGAILVIAIFYNSSLSILHLSLALSVLALLILLNRLKVNYLFPYLVGGVAMWYFMLYSGIHATITGVILAGAIPFGDGQRKSPSLRLQHFLHKPVAFVILPLFAMANTAIPLGDTWLSCMGEPHSLGILWGLIVGKPLGILLFSVVGVMLGLCALPTSINWRQLASVGFLGGIGFTMSIFITLLAFDTETLIISSKISIMTASLSSGIIGYTALRLTLPAQDRAISSSSSC